MAFHDQSSVAGITEACKYNDHSQCNNPKCGCDCHVKAAIPVDPVKEPNQDDSKPEKACPTCGVKRPYRETFCRVDGARLTSLVCALCGAGGDTGDVYCWKCGNSLRVLATDPSSGGTPSGSSLQVPSIGDYEVEPEVDYGKQVLTGIQKELASQKPEGERGEDGNQTVVEAPMGPGGSFKLVSSPSQVRVRNPAPASQSTGHPSVERASPRAGFRLPVKPS